MDRKHRRAKRIGQPLARVSVTRYSHGILECADPLTTGKLLTNMDREQLSTVAEQWLAAGRPDMAIEIWIQTDSLTKQAARIRSIIEDVSSKSPVSDEAEFSAYTTACLKLL